MGLAVMGGAMLAGGSAAQARDHEHYDRPAHVDVEVRWGHDEACQPTYDNREVRVWVAPVYRTVCDRVWKEPVYKSVCERVWVPEVWETREVRHGEGRHTWCTREQVLVSPGHYEERQTQQLVCAGHYEEVQRQELVCDGHYEVQTERVLVPQRPQRSPFEVVNPMLRGLEVGVRR